VNKTKKGKETLVYAVGYYLHLPHTRFFTPC